MEEKNEQRKIIRGREKKRARMEKKRKKGERKGSEI